jgi:hypothetical protein
MGGDVACSLLTAFGGTSDEQTLCADATDLAVIADSIKLARADSGLGMKANKCKLVPLTTVCATDTELATAIKARKGSK